MYSFIKCDLFFLSSVNLICRGTGVVKVVAMGISKSFRESLGLRDNESRL